MAKLQSHDYSTRLIHFGLAGFGVAAFIASDWAGQYKEAEHFGFTVHLWLGMAAAIFIIARLIYGIAGPENVRFSTWVPYTQQRLALVKEDLTRLARFQLPHREAHDGLAGLIQAIGLAAFAVMAITGITMFFFLETGQKATGWIHLIKEVHEATGGVVGAYLFLHVGAVVLHTLTGQPVWKRMFSD